MIKILDEKANDYVFFAKYCLHKATTDDYYVNQSFIDDNLIIICRYKKSKAYLFTVPLGNFLIHPRSGNITNIPIITSSQGDMATIVGIDQPGYYKIDNKYIELFNISPFPLYDNDKGTFVVSVDNAQTEQEIEYIESTENYGNIWWTNGEKTLSWKGPPSVQFGITANYNIPGVTQVLDKKNTAFGRYIYQEGAQLCEGPIVIPEHPEKTLVLGACIIDEYLICFSLTGHDLGIYKSTDDGKTWVQVSIISSTSYVITPVFIDKTGYYFVFDSQLFKLTEKLDGYDFVDKVPVAQSNNRIITNKGGYGSDYSYSGVEYNWPSITNAGLLSYEKIITNAKFDSSNTSSDVTPMKKEVPIYRGNPATVLSIRPNSDIGSACQLDTSDGFMQNFSAEVNGSYCSIQWSGVDCYNDRVASKKIPKCNTAYTVSATIQPQGLTASYTNTELADMTISGPKTTIVNSQYTANNANGEVRWTSSRGSISERGFLDVSGICGSVTITATDSCNRSASYDVLVEKNGYYITVAQEQTFTQVNGSTCSAGTDYACGYEPTYVESVSGNYKVQLDVRYPTYYNYSDEGYGCGLVRVQIYAYKYSICSRDANSGYTDGYYRKTTYQWICT